MIDEKELSTADKKAMQDRAEAIQACFDEAHILSNTLNVGASVLPILALMIMMAKTK
jgi:hypothetical protein